MDAMVEMCIMLKLRAVSGVGLRRLAVSGSDLIPLAHKKIAFMRELTFCLQ